MFTNAGQQDINLHMCVPLVGTMEVMSKLCVKLTGIRLLLTAARPCLVYEIVPFRRYYQTGLKGHAQYENYKIFPDCKGWLKIELNN